MARLYHLHSRKELLYPVFPPNLLQSDVLYLLEKKYRLDSGLFGCVIRAFAKMLCFQVGVMINGRIVTLLYSERRRAWTKWKREA